MLHVIAISLQLPSLTPQNWLIEKRLSGHRGPADRAKMNLQILLKQSSETMFTELSAKEET
jgi:hypothetical protein